jgi:ORF6N domain-containing protein
MPLVPAVIPPQLIERRIYITRGQRVMLDADLAELYQVPTKALNQAVRRNLDRFPEDFMFQLSKREAESLRSQIVTSKVERGGRRYRPYAFTEHGVAMLSSVLHSRRAVQMNIFIIRVFMKLREVLASHKDLAREIEQLKGVQQKQGTMLGLVVKDIQMLANGVKREFQKLRDPRRRKARIGFRLPED